MSEQTNVKIPFYDENNKRSLYNKDTDNDIISIYMYVPLIAESISYTRCDVVSIIIYVVNYTKNITYPNGWNTDKV